MPAVDTTTASVRAPTDMPPAANNNHSSADIASIKRKHSDATATPATSDATTSADVTRPSAQLQTDLLAILKDHDTTPSFLNHKLPKPAEAGKKRLKVEHGATNGDRDAATDQLTVTTRLTRAAYASFSEIVQDATLVSEQLVAEIRAKHQDDGLPGAARLSVDDLKQIQHVQAFAGTIKRLVDQETQYALLRSGAPAGRAPVSVDDRSHSTGTTVLTLFGNAPTPKQLFSSAQLPLAHQPSTGGGVSIKSELPVEELSLPPGISATQILAAAPPPPPPSDTSDATAAVKKRTFADAFAPPYSLAALPLPKPAASKRAPATTAPSSRDGTALLWEFRDPVQRSKKGGYTVQALTVGDWLAYGGQDRSPREKRKAREKALVEGRSEKADGQLQRQAEEAAERARDEAALFARAYSSFAPSRDDGKSLVSAETKGMVWWGQCGAPRFEQRFALDPALREAGAAAGPEEAEEDVDERGEAVEIVDEAAFGRIMDELAEFQEADHLAAAAPMDKTAVDVVLRQISDLLETLASHQHLRYTTMPTASPAAKVSLPATGSALIGSSATNGKPDEPTADERETYHALRRELTYLLLQLPPYVAAKLHGSQTGALGVRARIPFAVPDVTGSLEEDGVARQAKLAALTAASAVAALTNNHSGSANRPPSSAASQHYNSTAARTPAIGASANTRYGAQYAPPRTPVPPPPQSVQYQRPGSGLGQGQPSYSHSSPMPPQQQRSGWTAQQSALRPGGGVPAAYGQQQPQQPSNGQAQHYLQQQQQARPVQTPVNYGGGYKSYQQQQQTPQQRPVSGYNAPTAAAGAAQYPAQQQQQQRVAHTAAANAVAYQAHAQPATPSSGAPGLSNGSAAAAPRVPTPNSQPVANGHARPPSAA